MLAERIQNLETCDRSYLNKISGAISETCTTGDLYISGCWIFPIRAWVNKHGRMFGISKKHAPKFGKAHKIHDTTGHG